MYCKKCGHEIDNDSVFCNKCGAKQKAEESEDNLDKEEIEEEYNEDNVINYYNPDKKKSTDKKENSGCLRVVIGLIIILLIIIIAWIANAPESDNSNNENNNYNDNKYNEPQWFTRDATNNDITVTYETNYTALAVDIYIMPKCDIDNLEIEITYYDKNGAALTSQVKHIGNVKEGVQVQSRMALLDLSITDMFKLDTSDLYVVSGTVSYLK